MTTAREIFQRSLALLGQEPGENTEAFERRAPRILNLLLAELVELDYWLKGEKMPDTVSVPSVETLEDPLELDESIEWMLLPLGLAALLIQEEEGARGSFFLQLYENERETLRRRRRRGRRHKILRSF
ncbi:MAG: hypothetical protein IKD31_04925 [Clostridia bacterium]|nr:hypothetical protein [Clostridia bacterium]